MKHREPPRPINLRRPLPAHLKNDPQVIKWTKRLLGDDEARPTELSEEQLAFVTLEVAKRREDKSWLEPDLLKKAMVKTTPVLAAPKVERLKLVEDLELIWSQEEMRTFWDSWDGARTSKGPQPDFATGKGVAMLLAMSGFSSHVDDVYSTLAGEPDLWGLVERLEGRGSLRMRSYENCTRQIPRLYCHDLAIATNLEMVKKLREMNPNAGIGERLMIDGSGRPAWCKQTPKGKTEEQEERRRRYCPEAGARAYVHGNRFKADIADGEKGSARKYLTNAKFWRGYYDVCIADQATGLPLVWMSCDAASDEAACIVPLLSDLFRHWPECPGELIAGDPAWDEDNWCRLLECDYGIHPIFRLHQKDRPAKIADYSRDGTVASISEYGQLRCARHGRLMAMVGAETAPRHSSGEALRAGQSSDEAKFRVRAQCSKGCGRLGQQMRADWVAADLLPASCGRDRRHQGALRNAPVHAAAPQRYGGSLEPPAGRQEARHGRRGSDPDPRQGRPRSARRPGPALHDRRLPRRSAAGTRNQDQAAAGSASAGQEEGAIEDGDQRLDEADKGPSIEPVDRGRSLDSGHAGPDR